MARTNNNFKFLVMSCNFTDPFCEKVISELEKMFDELHGPVQIQKISMYFMDSSENELFFRDVSPLVNPNYVQRITLYYKTY
jgi:hypothetical protein